MRRASWVLVFDLAQGLRTCTKYNARFFADFPGIFHFSGLLAHRLLKGLPHPAHWCARIQEFSK